MPTSPRGRRLDLGPVLLYLVLTIAMTWPLTPGLARDVPGDLGDSLLTLWILGWGAEQLPRVAIGQMSWREFWNANIFHPEPLALGFSEHLFGQVIQILPVYWTTGNLILCYNLLFLSSFVLSGLGMYLLVRDLLGETSGFSRAAFVAGLIYAFVPLRIAQVAHIQSVSSQWMPFALYGFRRFLVASRQGGSGSKGGRGWWALAGGTAALLMQNWSSGYYLIFFAPLVVIFVLHQMFAAGRGFDRRAWAGVVGAGALVLAGTWPFLAMYLETARVHAFERPRAEVVRFSADVYSYVTAPEALHVWGERLQTFPKPEGELFFGVVPLLLILVSAGVGLGISRPWPNRPTTVRGWVAMAVSAFMLVQIAGLIGILATGGFVTSAAGITLRATNAGRLLATLVAATGVLLALSPSARQRGARIVRSPLALALSLTGLAIWLSWGPVVQSQGQPIPGLGLYGWFYEHVPGFSGLRVPARYAMIAALFASIAAGYGAAVVFRRLRRPQLVVLFISTAFLAEAAFAPMRVNQTWGDGAIVPPPRIEPASRAPAVYRALAASPPGAVVAEFPFGDPAWELRAVYYSTVHWRRLVNGYSGGFPRQYTVRAALLGRATERPEAAWAALRAAGTTHAVVHEAAYPPGGAAAVERWLLAHGARERGRFDGDILFDLPPAPSDPF